MAGVNKSASIAAFYREYAIERGRVLTAAARERMSIAELVRAVFEHKRCSPLEKYLATQYKELVAMTDCLSDDALARFALQGHAVLTHTLEQLDRGGCCAHPNMDPELSNFPDLWETWCDGKTLLQLLKYAKVSTCDDCKQLWLAAEPQREPRNAVVLTDADHILIFGGPKKPSASSSSSSSATMSPS